MKTFKLIVPVICLMLFLYAAIAQDKNTGIAIAVTESFKEMYPDAVVKKMDGKKDNKYEVEFVYENLEQRAYFTSDGTWLYLERDLAVSDVSAEALEAFKNSQWASWRIDKVEEISSPEYPVLYVIKVRREDNKMYLYYSSDGILQNASSKVIF